MIKTLTQLLHCTLSDVASPNAERTSSVLLLIYSCRMQYEISTYMYMYNLLGVEIIQYM